MLPNRLNSQAMLLSGNESASMFLLVVQLAAIIPNAADWSSQVNGTAADKELVFGGRIVPKTTRYISRNVLGTDAPTASGDDL